MSGKGTPVQELEQEVARLKGHLLAVQQEGDPAACARQFREHVSGARDPFHANYDGENSWTKEANAGCSCVIA